ncbi:uncharacterized protein METZ01_LOCUS373327, partial [marine metagenome]
PGSQVKRLKAADLTAKRVRVVTLVKMVKAQAASVPIKEVWQADAYL